MKYNPRIHHRKSIRLKGYDYSQEGLYFITICVQDRTCLFGYVGAPLVGAPINNCAPAINIEKEDGSQKGQPKGIAPMAKTMILNDAGKMIENEWLALKSRFPNIELHEYVVMPNHFHGILEIGVGAPLVGVQNTSDGHYMPVAQNTTNDNKNVEMQNELGNGQSHDLGRPQGHAPTRKTVCDILDAFKSITTVEYIHGVKQLGWVPFYGKLWQRDYYEHIIRDDQSDQTISNYIIENPAKWAEDKFYSR